MNKLFTKLLFCCALLFYTASNVLYAQCNTAIYAVRDTIACGESIFLQQTGVGGASSDDFTGSTLSGLWSTVTSGWTLTSPCGTNPLGAQHLWFAQGSATPRQATTVQVDASCGGDICFDFKMETQSPPPCDGPDLPGEGIYLQYRIAGGVWVTIHYFNPGSYNFAGWNNYCYPIPAAAQTSTTQFRWSQVQTSGPTWDQWGIDNVNIATCSGYSCLWSGGAIPAGYSLDTITVAPQDSTTYTLMYSNWINDTCTADITIYVAMPTITATQLPSNCTGSTQLDALASVPANCTYRIDLYDAAGDGWIAVGGNPPQYHNMDVMINGNLHNNYTMISGSGPDVFHIPVTDGDVLETYLQNWGSNFADCGYAIFDSQGALIRVDGLPPVMGGTPPVGCNTNSNSLPEVIVSCPTTLFYSYSWQTTAGTVTGLSNPNIYNPSVTVSTTTDYVVTGYDPLHPWCTAQDTITVLPNNSNITATLSGPSVICTGDTVVLSFLPMVGIPNWTLNLNVNGSPFVYTLDGAGNDISTGQPLTFYPVTTTTYDVVSLLDGTGCPAAVTNPSLLVTVNQIPNAGISNGIIVCEVGPLVDLFSVLGGNPDIGGTWVNSAGTTLLSSFYNPATSSSGVFTYTVTVSPCPSAFSTVTVTNNPLPSAGTNGTHTVCENSAAFNMYNFLGGTPLSGGSWSDANGSSVSNIFDPSTMSGGVFTYTVPPLLPCPGNSANLTITINQLPNAGANGTHIVCENDPVFNLFNYLTGSPDVGGIWTDVNNIPVPNMFNPSTSGSGTFIFTYTVTGANPCPDATATVTITVNPAPIVTISGTTSITQGMSTTIDFTLTTGTAPFTVVYDDGTGPIISPSFNSTTGTITVTPNSTTNYSLVSVTDDNGCTASVNGSVTITVNQLPTITLSGNATICAGQNSDLDFNLGGTPNFTVEYNINGVLNSYVFNNIGSNLLNVSPTTTTTYTLVSITDGNGVVETNISGSVTITVNPLPTAVLSGNNTICDGEQTPLNFTLTGAANYTLTYSPGGVVTLDASGNDVSTNSPVMVNPNTTTAYDIVSLTDANNCTNIGSGTATITVNPLPTISISGTTPICTGQSSNLSFTLSGTAPYNVNYLDGGSPASVTLDAAGTVNGTPLSVTPNNTTTYTLVDVTDDNNCTTSANGNITIVVNPLPTVTMSGSTSICDGQSTALNFNFTGIGPYNINYDINSTNTSAVLNNNIDSIVVSPSATTTYSLINVTDAYCSNTANGTVIITVNPLPSATISGGATLCADGSTAQIDFDAVGTGPFNVIYSDGFTNHTCNRFLFWEPFFSISKPLLFSKPLNQVFRITPIHNRKVRDISNRL